MTHRNSFFSAFCFGFLIFLGGCSAKVEQSVPLESIKVQTIAVLPVEYPSDVRRERIDYIRSALISELFGSGYIVLDDGLTKRLCSSPDCPERAKLAEKYGIDGFVKLTIGSVYRANVLAGYVNTISGDAKLLDRSNNELVKISDLETEKGGLLFNSGQLLQGFKSTVDNAENTGDDSFNRLAEKFVKNLVAKLPKPLNKTVSEAVDTQIRDVNVKPLGSARYDICVNGSENAIAGLIVNKTRTSLRQVAPGHYCGNFFLGDIVENGTKLVAEIRSPYGVAVQKDLAVDPFLVCDPTGAVRRLGASKLALDCAGSDESCSKKIEGCRKAKLWVFRGPATAGPYQRLGGFTSEKGVDVRGIVADDSVVVFAESPNGALSRPFELSK